MSVKNKVISSILAVAITLGGPWVKAFADTQEAPVDTQTQTTQPIENEPTTTGVQENGLLPYDEFIDKVDFENLSAKYGEKERLRADQVVPFENETVKNAVIKSLKSNGVKVVNGEVKYGDLSKIDTLDFKNVNISSSEIKELNLLPWYIINLNFENCTVDFKGINNKEYLFVTLNDSKLIQNKNNEGIIKASRITRTGKITQKELEYLMYLKEESIKSGKSITTSYSLRCLVDIIYPENKELLDTKYVINDPEIKKILEIVYNIKKGSQIRYYDVYNKYVTPLNMDVLNKAGYKNSNDIMRVIKKLVDTDLKIGTISVDNDIIAKIAKEKGIKANEVVDLFIDKGIINEDGNKIVELGFTAVPNIGSMYDKSLDNTNVIFTEVRGIINPVGESLTSELIKKDMYRQILDKLNIAPPKEAVRMSVLHVFAAANVYSDHIKSIIEVNEYITAEQKASIKKYIEINKLLNMKAMYDSIGIKSDIKDGNIIVHVPNDKDITIKTGNTLKSVVGMDNVKKTLEANYFQADDVENYMNGKLPFILNDLRFVAEEVRYIQVDGPQNLTAQEKTTNYVVDLMKKVNLVASHLKEKLGNVFGLKQNVSVLDKNTVATADDILNNQANDKKAIGEKESTLTHAQLEAIYKSAEVAIKEKSKGIENKAKVDSGIIL